MTHPQRCELLAGLRRQSADNSAALADLLARAKRGRIALDPRLVIFAEAAIDIDLAMRGLLIEEIDPQTGRQRRWVRDAPPNRKGQHGTGARCGARTRRGTLCKCLPVEGRRRCRLHRGASTGPKTADGRARIADSNRRRAEAKRAQKAVGALW